ncbi:hypothetical protein LPB248_01320 [Flavobacterium sp. LPB0248]|uniref:hypothetical protein n=1 Tax=Flavobacterium sp. LPB0248 TaxID=2614441 RepID=UPI0015A6018D|nr:hypothetical protein [Flavobacterium sp. LPB0248]QLC64961.1 hypothetical protein LPB248_01320 [Flavobacterium sp. LPB0248]
MAVTIQAQSLNPTSEISAPGYADAFKGGYTFSYATSGTPWNGALISFGGFQYNNYDCQISSDYGPNGGNHISYRTKNGDNNTWNSWNELATRGENIFAGKQIINGVVGIGTEAPNSLTILDVNGRAMVRSLFYVNDIMGGDGGDIRIGPNTGNPSSTIFLVGGVDASEVMRVNYNKNVGIGIVDPKNKLDVNGTIHSKEVKVDMTGWSDFVFKKEYNLPTLEEVEKHIAEKGHLENIPSEEEVLKSGINLGEMNAKLLQKMEEMTLYMIEQNKRINKIEKENQDLKSKIDSIDR